MMSMNAMPIQAMALSQVMTTPSSVVLELDSRVRDDLQNMGWLDHTFLWWLVASSIVVAVGVVFEGPEIVHDIAPIVRRWLRRPPRRKKPSRCIQDAIKVAGLFGWVLVVAGVVGEGVFEVLEGRSQGMLQTVNDAALAASNRDSALAIERAADSEILAGQLRIQTDALTADAAKSKRDMVAAQLELARFTGPIQSVPVIDGVASPDPTKGSKLRILLHRDTLIRFPELPKGKALSWTLFIVEDEVGQHQIRTSPLQFLPATDPGDSLSHLFLPPGTSLTMDLVTDETGTTDNTLGGATIVNPPAKTVYLK